MSADEVNQVSVVTGQQTDAGEAGIKLTLRKLCEVGGGITKLLLLTQLIQSLTHTLFRKGLAFSLFVFVIFPQPPYTLPYIDLTQHLILNIEFNSSLR